VLLEVLEPMWVQGTSMFVDDFLVVDDELVVDEVVDVEVNALVNLSRVPVAI